MADFTLIDFSNDDLDEDQNDEDDEPSSSLALSYKSAATTSTYIEPMKNTRNVTKTLLNQQQSQFKKTRSMTPETSFDDYDLLTVSRTNSKKQRSLTPEKRPVTPEILHRSSKNNSQTSLMSRQSSGSRNSTLERQLQRYEEGRLSRSSSSSSDAESNNRRSHRPQFKTNFGDYRIRRSR